MKKHISYPKIGQYRNVVSEVIQHKTYVGKDDNGDSIYDDSIYKPTINFTGTVKLHGTNAGISFSKKSGMYAQSRNNIITTKNDNNGFAKFVFDRTDIFFKIFSYFFYYPSVYTDDHKEIDIVTIFGEFAGKGIQKGTAISNLDKALYIFSICLVYKDGTKSWIHDNDSIFGQLLTINSDNIYGLLLRNFTYNISIDFNKPEAAIEELNRYTAEVELKCPIASYLGSDGVGEGIVWKGSHEGHDYIFKTKGEKHKVVKKEKITVNPEIVKTIKEFVDRTVTDNRVDQCMKEACDSVLDIKSMGKFLSWMTKDILTEEKDTIEKNNLDEKYIKKAIVTKARTIFMDKLTPINLVDYPNILE